MATLNLLSPDKVKDLAALKVVEEPFQMNVWKRRVAILNKSDLRPTPSWPTAPATEPNIV